MQTVNFKKYADIIVNLQMKNDSYYLIKRFDDDTLDYIRSQFDKESGLDFMDRFDRLSDEIVQLQKENVLPFRNCVPMKNELINIHCKQQIHIL